MKKVNRILRWSLLLLSAFVLQAPVFAQDDLYYDPATDGRKVKTTTTTTTTTTTYEDDNAPLNATRRYDGDDDYYEDDDDYAYQYSSRIRRFHRPVRVIDYYDPFFVDLWQYDPFYLPGASIYTYGFNDYWSWRRYRRYQRWNSWNNWNDWGYASNGWNSWGWGIGINRWNRWSAWNTPFVVNNYYYDPYWTWNGWNPYCSNVGYYNNYYGGGWNNWGNNGGWNNNNNNGGGNGYVPQTYTGVRRHGTSVNPGYARISGNNRLGTNVKDGIVIEPVRNGRSTLEKTPGNDLSDRSKGNIKTGATVPNPGSNNGRDRGRQPAPTTTRDGAQPSNDRVVEPRRPLEGRPAARVPEVENEKNNRPADERPARDWKPSRPSQENDRVSPAKPSVDENDRSGREVRPSRPSDSNDRVRPARPSVEENDRVRPSRPSGGDESPRPSAREARPARPSESENYRRREEPARESARPSRPNGGGESPSPRSYERPSRNDSGGGNNRSIDNGGSNNRSSGGSNSSGRSGGGGRGRD